MNYTKIKKEKLEIDYSIKKIYNILDSSGNLDMYIELMENNKLDTPLDLNKKILTNIGKGKIDNVKDSVNKDEKRKIKFDKTENKISDISKEKDTNCDFIQELKYKFVSIIKIAACTIVALMIWKISPTNTAYAQNVDEDVDVNVENQSTQNERYDLNRKVNNFFMNPIKIESREK